MFYLVSFCLKYRCLLPNLWFVVRTERADVGKLSAVPAILVRILINDRVSSLHVWRWGRGGKQSLSYSQYSGGYFLRSYLRYFFGIKFQE